jgi:hypothetical protein
MPGISACSSAITGKALMLDRVSRKVSRPRTREIRQHQISLLNKLANGKWQIFPVRPREETA